LFQAVLANAETLERWVLRLIHFGAFLLWLDFSLRYFGLSEASWAWCRKALATRLGFGGKRRHHRRYRDRGRCVRGHPSGLQILRQLLQHDVFPRVALPRGVPDAISTLIRYAMIGAALVMAPLAAGVDFSSLAFIAGGLGVGIGFGLQNVVANFVSGLILIFERPIQVGDSVKLGEFLGKVKTIGIRSSVVQTFDGGDVILPNSDLVSQPMLNWTRTDLRRRLRVEIIVEHGSDPHRVLEILGQAAADHEAVFAEPEPHLLFDGFSETGLHFALQCWVPIANLIAAPSELRLAIYDALMAEGSACPPRDRV
jgi:potassium efflux system protein